MRVYVTTATSYEQTDICEVFVHESDAKAWVSDQQSNPESGCSYSYVPRQLRTGWRL